MTANHGLEFAVERITPAKAERYLETNGRNRRSSGVTVRKYAESMRRNEWRLNGEAIKFDADGQLLDGQHRLLAVVSADRTIEFCVIRGLDRNVFKTLDDGKTRSAGDCLYVLEYKHPNALAAAGRILFGYERSWKSTARHFRRCSNDELLDVIKRHPALVTRGHEYMLRPLFTTLIPHSVGMFTYYLASAAHASSAKQFFTELATGKYTSDRKTHPARVLHETLEARAREIIKPSSNDKLAWVVQAWNTWYRGGATRSTEAHRHRVTTVRSGSAPALQRPMNVSRETRLARRQHGSHGPIDPQH